MPSAAGSVTIPGSLFGPVADTLLFVGDLEDWLYVLDNLDYLFGGLVVTIGLTIASILLGFAVGFPAGAIEVYGGRYSRTFVETVGIVLRGTPIVVILIFMYFILRAPDLYFGFTTISGAVVAGILGLGLRSGAYQSQIFRASLQSVHSGQLEAARAIGMTKRNAVRHVVVPQALRRSVPGFQNEVTIVLKDTSIVFAIGLAELLTRSYQLFTTAEGNTAVLEIILFISAIYFVLTFSTNRALDYVSDYYAIPSGETT
ncbi:polar amino acid transport system permease protein [Halalkaliarchaeum desulfuricum]|uniref:Polar amino acid transport system permease protein n=1 Tax=Halalkaliarchaeum desulfuricum TaxID=2055893 RepID=A0A343TG27_9EURY|nr:amino acid ABC transporter permease [Halalkaliarchaeum desulfuricum]AUX08049.1 polar amino acid transport system permease protein [Halalkaliarchaeum desulfuricum]